LLLNFCRTRILIDNQAWSRFCLLRVSSSMTSPWQESSGVRVNFRSVSLRNLTLTPHDGFGERQGVLRGFVLFNDEAGTPWPAKWGQSEVSAKGAQKVHSDPS